MSRKTGMRKKKKKKKGAGAEGGDKNTSGRSDGRPLTPNQDDSYRNLPLSGGIAHVSLVAGLPGRPNSPDRCHANFSIRATWLVWGGWERNV